MPKKLTTQEFIIRSRAVHGDKYGYAFSVYGLSNEKVLINCQKHGLFYQTANAHLYGSGCPTCGQTSQAEVVRMNKYEFVRQAKNVHGSEKYNYSKVNYINSYTKVIISCLTHGCFSVTPNSHLSGRGCPSCAGNKKLNTENFIEKAKATHDSKYDYSKVEYVNTVSKVIIVCHEHGDFEQKPNSHLNGNGCPSCSSSGFNRNKIGVIYVLRSDCGRYMKIGISNKIKKRHTTLKRHTPFPFKCVELFEAEGRIVAEMEKNLLSEYESVAFETTFDGHTEWRVWSDNIRGYLKNEFKK